MTDESNSQEIHRLDRGIAAAFEAAGDTAPPLDMPNPDEQRGTRIGPYKLLQEIGEGGFGRVYMAEQLEPVRRKVALKIIKPGMDTRDVIARFESERQALAMMDHANIARVFDAGATETGQPYFVMELVKGVPITEFCDKNNFESRKRLELFTTVCQAVQHAHQKGIIHRDLKPSNIMVTLNDGEPVPKVIDFGVAKAISQRLTEKTLFTQYGQMIGTPQYMSPEQAEMSALDIDTRSDIYSLGVLLYELLTGTTPLEADSLRSAGYVEMLRIIKDVEPAKPSTRLSTLGDNLTVICEHRKTDAKRLRQSIRGDLDWIVMKALDKQRDRRYETANGLAADLKRHLHNEPVVARPPSAAYKFKKAWRRNKVICTAGAAVMVALVMGIGISVWQAAVARREKADAVLAREVARNSLAAEQEQRLVAEHERERAEDNASAARRNLYAADIKVTQQHISVGNLGAAQVLLANHIPQDGHDDIRGWEWRHLWRKSRGDQLYRLEGHHGTVAKVRFSPNGRHLLSGGYPSGELILWDWPDPRLKPKLVKTLIQQTKISDFAVAPDGRSIGILSDSGELQIWDPELVRQVEVCPINGVKRFQFSPRPSDARVYVNDPDEKIVVWDRGTGEIKTLFGGSPARIDDISDDGLDIVAKQEESYVLWSIAEEAVLRTIPPDDMTRRVRLLPRGAGLLVPRHYRRPSVYEFKTGQWRRPNPVPEDNAFSGVSMYNQTALDGQSNLLATASFHHNVSLWNLDDFQLRARLHGHRDEVWCIDISPDHRFLASGGQDRAVLLWNVSPKSETNDIADSFCWSDPAFSPNGKIIVLRKFDTGHLSVVDLETVTEVAVLATSATPLRFSRDGALLFALSGRAIVSYDTTTWSLQDEYPLNFDPVPTSKAFQGPVASETMAVVVGTDGQIHVVGLRDGAERFTLDNDLGTSGLVAISPDERWIASRASDQTTIQVCDLHSNNHQFQSLTGHARQVVDLRFSPDRTDGRRYLVSSDADSTLRLWDVEAGQELRQLKGHRMGVYGADFSPDGRTVASASADHTLKLWNVETGREMCSFSLSAIKGRVRFSPDGRFVVLFAGYANRGRFIVFQAPSWSEIKMADTEQDGG